VPHGRVKGLKEAAAAFIRTSSHRLRSPDGNPVSLIFILLFPDKATDVHLQIYSELAEMVSDRDLRKTLAEAPDAESIHSTITRWQPHAQVSIARLFEDNRRLKLTCSRATETCRTSTRSA